MQVSYTIADPEQFRAGQLEKVNMETTEKITLRDHLSQYSAAQQTAIRRIFERHVRDADHPDFKNLGFADWVCRDVVMLWFDDTAMATVPGMSIGIEADGYSHT